MTCQQIIVPVAGMRAEPRLDAALDNEGLFGETVKISETENGFACARLLVDGYEGWIDVSALGHLPAATACVTVPMTHVTSTPDIKSPGLFTLSIGSAVQVRAPAGEMVEVAIADGYGFVVAHQSFQIPDPLSQSNLSVFFDVLCCRLGLFIFAFLDSCPLIC